jgi:hypothetical protein
VPVWRQKPAELVRQLRQNDPTVIASCAPFKNTSNKEKSRPERAGRPIGSQRIVAKNVANARCGCQTERCSPMGGTAAAAR